jgi:TolB-like protein/Tfp pilus assembly protein PilF
LVATLSPDVPIRFGEFTLDVRRGILATPRGEALLRPKAYTLLLHLGQNIGRVVPKAELMEAAWPGIYVTEDSLTNAIREIRRALRDDGQQIVRTVSRRGYILVGSPEARPEPAGQPIVAVLRFRNESGNAADESLVDGFAEGIINGVARFGTIIVLARNSSFQFSSYGGANHSAAAARIGADYLIEGSVRRSGTHAVIGVNLVDAHRSVQLWGEQYEAEGLELFAVQQEIGEQIIHRLVTRLDETNLRRAATKQTQSLAAYELVLRAADLLRRHVSGDAAEAKALAEEAIRRDPNYGLAYVYLGLARMIGGGFALADPTLLRDAASLATQGITLAPDQSQGHDVLALARLFLREHDGAEHEVRQALRLNPCDADALNRMGYVLALRGRPLEALAWFDRAVKLNPIHPQFYNYDRAVAHYLLGQYQIAADALRRSARRSPWIRTRLAACFAQLGQESAARDEALQIGEEDPKFSPIAYVDSGIAFEHASDREHLAEGVRRALDLAGLSPARSN